jgi:hypothetical protein
VAPFQEGDAARGAKRLQQGAAATCITDQDEAFLVRNGQLDEQAQFFPPELMRGFHD